MQSVSNSSNRPQIWSKELFADLQAGLYFTEKGLMGKDDNNIIQIMTDLSREQGQTINVPLTAKMNAAAVTGDSELEGNETKLSYYADATSIDQARFGVRLTGKMDEQKNSFDMRTDGKNKLKTQMTEFIERQCFLKLGGVLNTSITDVNGTVVGTDALWSNTVTQVPSADEAAGTGNRYICSLYQNGAGNMTQFDSSNNGPLTPRLISWAKRKAFLASPKIRPVRVDGKDYFVLFIHPWQGYDLRNNQEFRDANLHAMERGSDNPIFQGMFGIWDGVIIHEHEYVPYLNPVASTNQSFSAAGSGTQPGGPTFRALLCGAQAGLYAQCKNPNGWVEKEFDYNNIYGVSTGIIGGIDKITFNSKDYGVISIDTTASNLA